MVPSNDRRQSTDRTDLRTPRLRDFEDGTGLDRKQPRGGDTIHHAREKAPFEDGTSLDSELPEGGDRVHHAED